MVSLALSFVLAADAFGGEYHVEEQVCSECHTAHFSQHGRPPAGAEPGGPFEKLLLFSSPTKLCLSCHDGSDVDAPDVLEPVTTSYAPDQFSGGGYFQYSGETPSPNGHDLGVFPAEVPFSGMAPLSLQCTSCHNPHGNAYYRNLIPEPGVGAGTALAHNNPSQPTDNVFEQIHPDGANPSEAYRTSNIAYRAEMSEWCAECHDRLLPNQPGTLPAHFQAHPSGVAIGYGAGVHVDERHWLGGTGAGFGEVIGDGLPGIPRVRFQTPSATSFESARLVSAYNEVFCATCHFAHGGPYAAGATWPYKSPTQKADAYAPCQQCHNQ
ncbi:MAG: cytochrome c [Candidatus Abyssubacteria bacterium]